ncbi:lysophospholipid acyltransferase [Yasminevirus sp. GU-2018]|uniref:Lysophospholipid acyltransferase n=1 Tax=Yasminevirus sp. GU-2018 TaxID=2420051 RepID=A0A5K0U7D6_9VIRU|nr:lysophospholipid acyltransferase [Yasminevirus sp. GU-2018]
MDNSKTVRKSETKPKRSGATNNNDLSKLNKSESPPEKTEHKDDNNSHIINSVNNPGSVSLKVKSTEEDIDYDKILNSICYCGVGLPWKKDEVVMMYPCEHMLHSKCYDKLKDECPLCKTPIERVMTMYDDDLHHQRFADMLSMTYYDDMSATTPGRFLDSIFDIASVFARIPFADSRKSGKEICEHVFSLNNLTMKVYGMDKLKLEKNKVFICNHVSHFEFAVIYYLLGTGFLASSIVGQSKIVDQLKQVVPLLTFARGDKNRTINIVDEMRNFVDEKGSICLFPEGLMKHPDALVRFRSGAFHVGRPVYAITIRHNNIISDGYINGFLYKLGGKRDMAMEVHILGPYYPPFSEADIEGIRHDMARVGNMVVSRVSNRDVVDKKGKKADI